MSYSQQTQHKTQSPNRSSQERNRQRTERAWLGRVGETAATHWLQRNGYGIIARNVRTYGGELDIIAREGEYIVFVEVKTRRSDLIVPPEANVGSRKQSHLIRSATSYLQKNRLLDTPWRIDIVSVVVPVEWRQTRTLWWLRLPWNRAKIKFECFKNAVDRRY